MMSKEKTFQIKKEWHGFRLDQVLSHFVESRTQAVQLIQSGSVRIKNVQNIKPSYRVEEGDQIYFTLMEIKKEESLEPYPFPINVIHEDSSILVVEKPVGLVSHPSAGHPQDSLVNALIHKLNLEVGYSPCRPGLLHRLDKNVSGLLVLSKTHSAHNILAQQFLSKKIKRKYWALCYEPILYDEGRIETFIQRHPVNRKKFIVSSSEGKKAVTLFKVLKKNQDGLALIEFHLLTGRTHQVRIHSNEISGGVAGDDIYTSCKRIKNVRDCMLVKKIKSLNRVALHAVELTFIHPETRKTVTFCSSFPKELQDILDMF